jgi:hypothetical protein
LHGHCHQKAIAALDGQRKLLEQLGLEVQTIQSTCCGVAGSFGYEKDKYDLSMQIGEAGLLPKVREAPKDALIIADGFSCRSQIEHATDRQALHVAEVVKMALEHPSTAENYPEQAFAEPRPWVPSRQAVTVGLIAAGLITGATAGWWFWRQGRGEMP